MKKPIFKKTLLALLVIPAFFYFSNDKEDNAMVLEDPKSNYCSAIDLHSKTSLSEQLSVVSEEMKTKTGVYVLEQGAEAMLTRAWLSDNAEKTIDVQYFIFSTDNIGIIAIDYLIRAADRGVKVRLLIDDLMIETDEKQLLRLNKHPNISIKIYNPNINIGKNISKKIFNLVTDFHGFNQRMHNKTFTVDGKVAITGGRNIADEYFGYDHEYNFRDRDVLLLGKKTNLIQNSFNTFWNDELSVPVDKVLKTEVDLNNNFNDFHQYACNPENFLPVIRKQIEDMPEVFDAMRKAGEMEWLDNVEYITDLPGKNNNEEFLGGSGISTEKLIQLVKSAKKSITIQTPYLVTTDLGKFLMKEAVSKGVVVNILTNSIASNDNLEAFSGYQRDREKLLETGVNIFEFKPDAKIRQKVMSEELQKKLDHVPIFGLHAKSMVIDGEITVIGTFNLDPRSANLNTESIVVIPSIEISKEVEEGMFIEMQSENAWKITKEWNPDSTASKIKQLKIKSRRIVPKSIL